MNPLSQCSDPSTPTVTWYRTKQLWRVRQFPWQTSPEITSCLRRPPSQLTLPLKTAQSPKLFVETLSLTLEPRRGGAVFIQLRLSGQARGRWWAQLPSNTKFHFEVSTAGGEGLGTARRDSGFFSWWKRNGRLSFTFIYFSFFGPKLISMLRFVWNDAGPMILEYPATHRKRFFFPFVQFVAKTNFGLVLQQAHHKNLSYLHSFETKFYL